MLPLGVKPMIVATIPAITTTVAIIISFNGYCVPTTIFRNSQAQLSVRGECGMGEKGV